MSRVHVSLPSLIHGISQLPSAVRQPVHALTCDNTWPTVEHGEGKRPPSIHVKKLLSAAFGDAYVHGIDRGAGERYMCLMKLFDASGSGAGSIKVWDLVGAAIPVKDPLLAFPANDPDFVYMGLTAADVTAGYLATPSKNIRALSVLDYTFIVNRRMITSMNGTVHTTDKPKGLAFVFIRQGLYAQKYTVKMKIAGATYTVVAHTHDAIGIAPISMTDTVTKEGVEVWDYSLCNYPNTQYNVGPIGTVRVSVKSEDIAQNITDKLNGAVWMTAGASAGGGIAAGTVTATRFGSVIMVQVTAAATDYDSFEVTTSQGDNLATGIWNEIGDFEKLPLVCQDNYVVKVRGNAADSLDDYFVQFQTPVSSAFGDGVWEECPEQGLYTNISDVTSPHVMVRRTDTVGAATGVVGQIYFTFEPTVWDAIACGNVESNPNPSWISGTGTGGGGTSLTINRRVNEVVFFRDRLCFLSDDSVSTSEQGEYFNFFRTTVKTVPDSDPVDVALSTDKVTTLHSGVPFTGKLILFSEDAQHQLLGAPSLTPATVEASQVSRFRSLTGCRPIAYRDGIYFANLQGSASGLRSLQPSGQTDSTFDALDLAEHVPSLILGTATQIAVSTDSSVAAVLATSERNAIYILKQHREGDKLIQSAWVRFTLGNAIILGMEFFDSKLYLLTQRSGATTTGVHLEYIDLSPGIADGSRDYWLHLDRRVSDTTSGVGIAFGAGVTTVTLPYAIEPGVTPEVVTTANLTRYTGTVTGETTFTVPVNLTGLAFVAGCKYTSSHAFHRPSVATDPGSGRRLILDATSAVISLSVRYEHTSYLKLVVGSYSTPVGSSTVGFVSTEQTSGTARAGIGGRLDSPFDVSVQNDTPFPHNLISAEFLLNANIRSAAIG